MRRPTAEGRWAEGGEQGMGEGSWEGSKMPDECCGGSSVGGEQCVAVKGVGGVMVGGLQVG